MEHILTISAPDAALERFATLLMQIFNGGTKLLILEESAMENVLIPSMRTADNTCRILKCLKACEYLHATKKNRYPLVVYSHHRSLQPALIALKSDRILDSDVELMIEESRYAEWYSTAPTPEHFIPLTENRIGGVSY